MHVLLFIFDFYHNTLTVISSCGEFRTKKIVRRSKKFPFFQCYIAMGNFRTNCFNMHKAYDSCLMDQFLSLRVLCK